MGGPGGTGADGSEAIDARQRTTVNEQYHRRLRSENHSRSGFPQGTFTGKPLRSGFPGAILTGVVVHLPSQGPGVQRCWFQKIGLSRVLPKRFGPKEAGTRPVGRRVPRRRIDRSLKFPVNRYDGRDPKIVRIGPYRDATRCAKLRHDGRWRPMSLFVACPLVSKMKRWGPSC